MKATAVVVGKSLLDAATFLLRLAVLQILWGWIITSQFGVTTPSLLGMLCLLVLARAFVHDGTDNDCSFEERIVKNIGISVASLAIGYIAKTLAGF